MVPYCYLFLLSVFILWFTYYVRVATVREKSLEKEKNSSSGKNQGISISVREI